MGAKIDLVGQVFGRLTVIKETEQQTKSGQYAWVCKCSCGGDAVVAGHDLRKGHTQSCGCLQKERTSKAKKTHGMRHSKEYNIWSKMWGRCANTNGNRYEDYGGRGITICDRWGKFENFFADMGKCPAGFSIERVDNDGNYEPSNCVWADAFTQAKNRRIRVDNKSGVPGVFWYTYKGINKWAVTITRRKKVYRLGYFEKLEDAIAVRKEAEQRLDFAPLSDISINRQSA